MRDLLFFACVCIFDIALGTFLFYFGPASLHTDVQNALQSSQAQTEGAKNVPFQVLEQGTGTFSIADRTNYRITSQYNLELLWPMIYGDQDAPRIPNVDFTKYEVLAVFDGTHSTDGYGIQVTGISDLTPVRTLTIEHLVPSASCAVTDGLTEPFELIQVPVTSFSLAHVDVTDTSACGAN